VIRRGTVLKIAKIESRIAREGTDEDFEVFASGKNGDRLEALSYTPRT